jgi:hypothetical protein
MARSGSLSGLVAPRQLVVTSRGLIEDHAERPERPDSVRKLALIQAKSDAMTEALQRGLGVLISHMVYGDIVQCTFERGTVTRSIS